MHEQIDDAYIKSMNSILDVDISAYVESSNDIPFWNFFFKHALPDKTVQIMTYSSDDNSEKTGKPFLLNSIPSSNLGSSYLVCVDSDYDYYFDKSWLSESPYILQTYVHSIENYKVHPTALNEALLDLTYSSNCDFCFHHFFEQYCQVANDIFKGILYIENLKKTNIEEYKRISNIHDISNTRIKGLLTVNASKYIEDPDSELMHFRSECQSFIEEINKIKNKANCKIKTPNEIDGNIFLMHIKGHYLKDLIVDPVLKEITKTKRREAVKNIENKNLNTEQRKQQIKYQRNLFDKINPSTVVETQYKTMNISDLWPYASSVIKDIKKTQEVNQVA